STLGWWQCGTGHDKRWVYIINDLMAGRGLSTAGWDEMKPSQELDALQRVRLTLIWRRPVWGAPRRGMLRVTPRPTLLHRAWRRSIGQGVSRCPSAAQKFAAWRRSTVRIYGWINGVLHRAPELIGDGR